MTTRNLDALFEPKAIALFGASNHPGSVGSVLARNLQAGGLKGPVMMVNPHETAIGSSLSYQSVGDLPVTPDLAVIATPPPSVPELVAALGARGCRAAVVVTAGFGEGGRAEGERLRAAMLEAARPHLLRIVGPNCLGVMGPAAGVNASFAHIAPHAGDIAFLSQSGALVTGILDWAEGRSVGFSHIVSLGDMADVDFGDLLDHLAQDRGTRAILLYVESVTSARKFMSAARAAARAKPVIVIKAGRSQGGAKAAMSHTGALAGSDAVYDAAFRRAGMLRVTELREIFEAAETLSRGLSLRGERLTILTNGGGAGVLAADALEALGGELAPLGDALRTRLDGVLPASWSRANPVDIIGDADGARYAAALDALLDADDTDALLVMNCPTGVVSPGAGSGAVIEALATRPRAPVLTCWLGEATARDARSAFAAAGVASYDTPDDAVRAFTHLVEHRRNQALLLETPPASVAISPESRAAARAVVAAALDSGRTRLTEAETKQLLEAYGVACARTRSVQTPEAAAEAARALGGRCAVKVVSPDIVHKSDAGGVRLDLDGPEAVLAAARDMIETVSRRAPGARIEGFAVEEMVVRPHALELIAGLSDDPVFGPVVLFGQGGVAVEVVADRALGLPPLSPPLARDIIRRTRIHRLLEGYRDVPPANLAAIEMALIRLGDIAIDIPEIAELDINPLLADAEGVIALDARAVVRRAGAREARRLAIRPYPVELDGQVSLRDGRTLPVRSVRPEDAPHLVDLTRRCDPEDLRLRFFSSMRTLPEALAQRLSQIDYDRETALVAVEPDGAVAGVVRLHADPDNQRADYAILVRSDLKGQGLGYALMRRMLEVARARGLQAVEGDVLSENRPMLDLVRDLGGAARHPDGDPAVFRVRFALSPSS